MVLKNHRKHIVIFLFGLMIFSYQNIRAQVIIVNRSNPISTLSKAMVRNIFLGNSTTWGTNTLIKIADYTAEMKIRNDFSKEFLNLSTVKVSMIWIKVSLSGKSKPPKIFRDQDDLKQYVAENEGAIGYINPSNNYPDNVKVISISQ